MSVKVTSKKFELLICSVFYKKKKYTYKKIIKLFNSIDIN